MPRAIIFIDLKIPVARRDFSRPDIKRCPQRSGNTKKRTTFTHKPLLFYGGLYRDRTHEHLINSYNHSLGTYNLFIVFAWSIVALFTTMQNCAGLISVKVRHISSEYLRLHNIFNREYLYIFFFYATEADIWINLGDSLKRTLTAGLICASDSEHPMEPMVRFYSHLPLPILNS